MTEKWRNETDDGARDAVTISRDYEFPRKAVFEMFTDETKAAKFWGPEDAEKIVFRFEAKHGGVIRIQDRHGDGNVTRTSGTVTEVVAPKLIVFRSATTFGAGDHAPFEALQTVRFDELGPQRTRVTVLVKILSLGAFPADVESLEAGYVGGWGETLEMFGRELR